MKHKSIEEIKEACEKNKTCDSCLHSRYTSIMWVEHIYCKCTGHLKHKINPKKDYCDDWEFDPEHWNKPKEYINSLP